MPESVKDRCTKSHEYIFLLSKSANYSFDYEAIQEEANYDGRKDTVNKGSAKYDGQMIMPGSKPQGMAAGGHERWQKKERTQMQGYAQAGGHRDNSGGFAGEVYVRNKRDVWSVCVKPNKETHFATYPEELIVPCILAGCPEGGVVLDPFMGSGTTGIVARKLNRNFIGCELNPAYRDMAERRIFNNGENLFNQ